MQTTQDLQVWAIAVTTLNAFISAGVAIFAVWLGQRRTDQREADKDARSADNKRREVLRTKLEELITSAHEHYEELWERTSNVCTAGLMMASGQPPSPYKGDWTLSPKARVDMLQTMYFPQLAAACNVFGQAGLGVHQFIAAESNQATANPQLWHAQQFPTFSVRQSQIMGPVRTELGALENAAKALVQGLAPI